MSTTPVTAPWELGLTPPAMPGLAWPTAHDETDLSEIGARAILNGDELFLAPVNEEPPIQPVDHLPGRHFFVFGESERPRVIRYSATPLDVLAVASFLPDETDEAKLLVERVEGLRAQLRLPVDRLAEYFEVGRRTFYTYLAGALPSARLADLRARLDVASSFFSESADATRTLLGTRSSEVGQLLGAGEFAAARALFTATRTELEAVARDAREAVVDALLGAPDAAQACVATPGFQTAAEAYAALRPLGGNTMDREHALIDLGVAIKAGHEGGDLTDRWDFLPTLTHAAMDELMVRGRAAALAEDFDSHSWASFIETEADRAWAAYSPNLLPPDPVTPIEIGSDDVGGWEPDLARFGVTSTYEHES